MSSAKDLCRKDKTKEQFITEWKEYELECVRAFASLNTVQANKQETVGHEPIGKPVIKVKLYGKVMTRV